MEYIASEHINKFFDDLNKSGIQYVLIKNIGGELPNYLEDGKDIDILVLNSEQGRFSQFMKEHDFESLDPPMGRKNGWNFAYRLPEYQFWKKRNIKYTFYIDASFKLACKSLMPNMWIPLDQKINNDIWKNKVFDSKNNWWIMDEKTIFVYMIARSILDKHMFKDVYISDIEKKRFLLDDAEIREKLSLIFFKYTDHLIELIKNGSYATIFDDYIAFTEY